MILWAAQATQPSLTAPRDGRLASAACPFSLPEPSLPPLTFLQWSGHFQTEHGVLLGATTQDRLSRWERHVEEAGVRHFLRAYLYKVAVVAGLLILIALVSADIWLWQRDDGSGQAAGAGQGAQESFQVPGLPSRNSAEDGGPASSGGSEPRHLELNVSDAVGLEDSQGGTELTAGDGANVTDAVTLEVQEEQTPAPSGGPTDAADVEDSVDLVVRDAAGNIKTQETVK